MNLSTGHPRCNVQLLWYHRAIKGGFCSPRSRKLGKSRKNLWIVDALVKAGLLCLNYPHTANLNFHSEFTFDVSCSVFESHQCFCTKELSCLPYKNQNKSLTLSSLAGKFKFAAWWEFILRVSSTKPPLWSCTDENIAFVCFLIPASVNDTNLESWLYLLLTYWLQHQCWTCTTLAVKNELFLISLQSGSHLRLLLTAKVLWNKG